MLRDGKGVPGGNSREPHTGAELLPMLYAELRRMAARRLSQERPGQTLQPTALVHEAWLRIAGQKDRPWNSPEHFYRAAADAMRHILVDKARRKLSLKRGAQGQRVELDTSRLCAPIPDEQLLEVDEALDQLAAEDPEAADLVKLRFFAGFEHQEAAQMLGLSRTAADRAWFYARAWLAQRIKRS